MKFSTLRKSLILLAIVLLAALPAAAFAGGSGTSSDPYQVATADDLKQIANDPSAYYKQTENIILNDPALFGYNADGAIAEAGGAAEWTPVDFSGSYDGNKLYISGIYVSEDNANGGLFGTLTNATVTNLFIDFSLVEADEYAGLLAGKVEGTTTISNTVVSGSVIGKTTKAMNTVGGIVGKLGEDATITTSASYADVSGATSYSANVGGVAGLNYGTVTKSAFAGKVIGTATYYDAAIGGIVGYNAGDVNNCRVENAAVKGESTAMVNDCYVGGVVGLNKGVVEYNVNTSAVSVKNYSSGDSICAVGGIVGATVDADVYESKNSGAVSGEYAYAGGVVGVAISDSGSRWIEYCNNEGSVSSLQGVAGGIVGRAVAAGEGYVSIILNISECNNTGSLGGNKTGEVAGETAKVDSAQVNVGEEEDYYEGVCNAPKVSTNTTALVQYGSKLSVSADPRVGSPNLVQEQIPGTDRWLARSRNKEASGAITIFAPKSVMVTLYNVADASKTEIMSVDASNLTYADGKLNGYVIVKVYTPSESTTATAVTGVSVGNKFACVDFATVDTYERIDEFTVDFENVECEANGTTINVNVLVVEDTDSMNPLCANKEVTK